MSEIFAHCRFCDRALTEENRTESGRYSCPTCAPTYHEALLGWLPSMQVRVAAAVAPAGTPGMAHVTRGHPWLAHDRNGQQVSRPKTCECGKAFTQALLSERFLAMIERRSKNCLTLMEREIPGGWVPVHCPPCESKDLGMQARRASYLNYTDRDEAAD